MSNLSHPIKAPRIAIVNFMDCRQTEIHAQGCTHNLKGNSIIEVQPGNEPSPGDPYNDDWYRVAPCARKAA